ncbi:N-acyl amino acid synthase FeeM domain-containing protein [Rhodopirellula sp. JC639]|uniref:N-acyl amino acid synthase FeeM domain-containing protein n=1 Tax=Stieleria mannarensis TaxID=2755585 RepID=UPI001C71D997|nr:long-chain N-acyl amino acid synthase [Rhodopirellula sp. JC639]
MFVSVASEWSDKNRAPAKSDLDITIARTRSELYEAFQLVYNAYTRAGLEKENKFGLRMVKYHFLPTTEVMIGKLEGIVVSTATLIVDGELGLPAESMYGDTIEDLRNCGKRFAEVGCLADCRASPARFFQMIKTLASLLAQTAEARGCQGLLAATHPRHARFYVRQLGFERVGGIRNCPYAQGNPAVPLLLEFDKLRGTKIHDQLFGKRFSEAALAPYVWSESTREHFSAIWNQIENVNHRSEPSALVGPTFNLQPSCMHNPNLS